MMTTATAIPGKKISLNKIGAASFIGTTMEWYDFFIYSTAAALVFNQVFFPSFDPLIGTILAFSTFAAGYLVRPLGAVLLGHFGDRVGRKSVLIITLLSMGISTVLVGLLPTYSQIGVWAPILLVTLRMLQGLAVGGEWGGAVLIASENAPESRKTFYASFAQMGSPAGLLTATVVFTIIQLVIPAGSLETYGWRIPFWIASLLIPIGLVIRLRVHDAPEFIEASRRQESGQVPVLTLFRTHWSQLIVGVFAFLGVFAIYYLLTSFVLTYATQTLGMTAETALPANIISAIVEGLGIALGVWLSKQLTARLVAAVSAICLGVWSIPAFMLMHTAEPMLLYVAVGVAMLFVGTSYGVLAGEVAGLFAPTVRYTGIGLCYHMAGALGGGLAPLIATALLRETGNTVTIVILCVVVAAVMFVACLKLPKRDLTDVALAMEA